MLAAVTIAGLTLREAVRRRFVYAGLLISVAFLLIAFLPIHLRRADFLPPDQLNVLVAQLIETHGGHIAEFFAFLFSVSLSAGTISNEIERGVLSVILPKPIGRWSVYAGKWLGVNLFVLSFLLIWVALLQFAIYNHVHQTMPNLWKAFGVMALYPVVFSSVTFFFSSFTSNLLATTLPLIIASVAESEGILKRLGYGFDVESLKVAAKLVTYVAPLNPMSRWVEKVLNPGLLITFQQFTAPPGPSDPPANWFDLGWIASYAAVLFIAGLVIFQKRDI